MIQPRVNVNARAYMRGLLLVYGCWVFADTSET